VEIAVRLGQCHAGQGLGVGARIDQLPVVAEDLDDAWVLPGELASTEPALDLKAVLRSPATFTIRRPNGDIPFHGILAEFRQLHQVDKYTFYQAKLVPRLWWLSLTHHNQVFLEQTVRQILAASLALVALARNLSMNLFACFTFCS
jgi:uncharacterized protein involved in type VI secretion and phage assembly